MLLRADRREATCPPSSDISASAEAGSEVSAFVSKEFKTYLFERGIASSTSSVYHPSGILSVWILERRRLSNMKATDRWSVINVNVCLESKCDHFLIASIIAVASFSQAG